MERYPRRRPNLEIKYVAHATLQDKYPDLYVSEKEKKQMQQKNKIWLNFNNAQQFWDTFYNLFNKILL